MNRNFILKFFEKIIRRIDCRDKRLLRKFYHKFYQVDIGKYTYGFHAAEIAPGTMIGNFCSIAGGVKIGLMNHPYKYVSTHPFLYFASRGFMKEDKNIPKKKNVVIEDDVWLSSNAIILPGVVVHKGAIVGAGAVVTKDIPSYAIVGGYRQKLFPIVLMRT